MTTVYFDLDGTLMDHAAAERAAALTLYRITKSPWSSPQQFCSTWHAAQERHFRRYLSGDLSFPDQRRTRVREVLGVSLTDAQADELFAVYLSAYEANWQLYPDVVSCLDRLAYATLGVLSNGDEEQQRRKLDRLGISERFRHVVISGAVGCSKPSREIFREACARANADPPTTVYVGDHFESDVVGANQAGLVGVWLNRSGASALDTGVWEIRGLGEFPDLVQRLVAA